MSLWSRIANPFRGDRLSREIDEELRSHIEEALRDRREPAEARKAFGSLLLEREASLDIRLLGWLLLSAADSLFSDGILCRSQVEPLEGIRRRLRYSLALDVTLSRSHGPQKRSHKAFVARPLISPASGR